MGSTRNEKVENAEIWARLAAPLPESAILWRQDGNPVQKGDRYVARFVAYVDASTVRERLDEVVPGEWNLALELLPALHAGDEEGSLCAFKARLEIRGVVREDVGVGRDYKSAATDAFKRAAVRFGVAHELYAYERNWVELDGDSRNARPVEDPAAAYARKLSNPSRTEAVAEGDHQSTEGAAQSHAPRSRLVDEPACPKCGGRMWDNRSTKRNPRAPDFKCRDRSCDGVLWPERPAEAQPAA